jgi:phosphopantetheine--protein transferase-like protein
MIRGVGTDIVRIDRFEKWKMFSYDQKRRIFSNQELLDCGNDISSLAVRFAAKEAFFKALCAALVKLGKTEHQFSFLFLCSHVEVVKEEWGVPSLKIAWTGIEERVGQLPILIAEVSLSHEKDVAMAFVVLME